MEDQENTIQDIIKKGLEEPITDLAENVSEMALDAIVSNPVINTIPWVSFLVSGIKSVKGIRDLIFAKKLLAFLQQFHNGQLSEEEHTKFMIKIEDEPNYRSQVVDHIIIMNERFIDAQKSIIFANLLQAHLKDKLAWNDFVTISICLDNFHLRGISYLDELANKEERFYDSGQGSPREALLLPAGIVNRYGGHLNITPFGIILYYVGIRGNVQYDWHRDLISAKWVQLNN